MPKGKGYKTKRRVTITPYARKQMQEKAEKRKLKKRKVLKAKKMATATGPKRK